MFQTLMLSELTFDTMSERAQVLACAVMHSCARILVRVSMRFSVFCPRPSPRVPPESAFGARQGGGSCVRWAAGAAAADSGAVLPRSGS
jgi:hypothetical protein